MVMMEGIDTPAPTAARAYENAGAMDAASGCFFSAATVARATTPP